jgi:hypothetical protein
MIFLLGRRCRICRATLLMLACFSGQDTVLNRRDHHTASFRAQGRVARRVQLAGG